MAVNFVRCNGILSYVLDKDGKHCKHVVTAEDDEGVIKAMINHISECQDIDGSELTENIRICIKTH
ncbi:MAG: hypothetical protein FI721_01045 [SAR202 cluster bacterium]|nr:hypothetical protein [SAR202 cluster bacterium]MQG85752.1 hypothetical protein [SAR202 cluster bacterium]|tara:strand:+ start:6250 stop:6447 length:198 start_codon:yes stop_codon:yes gene_type:complete